MTITAPPQRVTRSSGLIGAAVERPDVRPKLDGSFEFSNDVIVPGMLFGATVRSPYPHAQLLELDDGAALAMPEVARVLAHGDLPTTHRIGHIAADQPVFVDGVARFAGEPVAFVVATSQEAAWRAADLVAARWRRLSPIREPADALADGAALVHPDGNIIRRVDLRRGPPPAIDGSTVVVEGEWSTSRQDQAFLAPESAVARPDPDGGVTLVVATQDLHTDQRQIATALGLRVDQVRLVLSGVGGAFGGREDITCQIHLALGALLTGRPVKTTYRRSESFLAHPKRHPAQLRYRLGASPDGRFRFLDVDIVLDAGPYASTSGPVLGSACYFAAGPYRIPSVRITGRAVRTNNPVSGAMRGFGAVQACFGIESSVDLLAGSLAIDPIELRRRNVLQAGDHFPTSGQLVVDSPLDELIDRCLELQQPRALTDDGEGHPYDRPGGTGLTTSSGEVTRGTGFALGVKNHLYGEGVAEWSTASVAVSRAGALVTSAASEVGQGIGSALAQIASTELGGMSVKVDTGTTAAGYAGSSSASRQTWMSGAAVRHAAAEVARRLIGLAATSSASTPDEAHLDPEGVCIAGRRIALGELLGDDIVSVTTEYRAPTTHPGDPIHGQGDVHVSWMFVAHRAIVDVDAELGLVKVVQVATAQDVGRAINPREVIGQIRGGITQGVGLALSEQLIAIDGAVLNNSFTDYLIPTAADVPPIEIALVERPDPASPYGLRGAGEPPAISSTAAIAAAVRAATKQPVTRVPILPDDLIGGLR